MISSKVTNLAIALFLFLMVPHRGSSQIVIADGLLGCLDPTLTTDGVSCGGGSSTFAIVGSEFVVNNIDGGMCCAMGGDWESYFEFGPIDISSFSNVGISMDYSADPSGYEDDSPGMPVWGCGSPFTNSHDQIVFTYTIDGTYNEDLYVHGTTAADFTGTWNTGNVINGMTLTIRVWASNKAQAEVFRFTNLQVTADPPSIDAGPDLSVCIGNSVTLQGNGEGTWSGGLGVFGDVNDPNSTYTPDPSEDGTSVTLTYTGNPVTTICGNTYPPPSDDMIVNVSSPVGILSGGGDLCPGECVDVNVSITGGQEPYELDVVFNSSVLPPIPVTFPGFTLSEVITVCFGGTPGGNNTINLPLILEGNSGTLTLVELSDANGCNDIPQNSSVTINFLSVPVAQDAELEACDEGNGEGIFDFTSLESEILNGIFGTVTFYDDPALTNQIFPPYIGPSTTIYAVVNNGTCDSDPALIDLIVTQNGDAGFVSMTCGQNEQMCVVCDSDGIDGEDVQIDFLFEEAIDYEIELVYFIDGIQYTDTYILTGPFASLNFNINGDADFQVISITPEGDCKDVEDMPDAVQFQYQIIPEIFPIGPFVDCEPIKLPEIQGINLTGNAFYNSEPDGSGVYFNSGDLIGNTTTIYAIDGILPDCIEVLQIDIEIGSEVNLTAPDNDTTCGYYVLPPIPNEPSDSSVKYYTESGGNGTEFMPGDTLFQSDTLFLFDINASCPSNEPSFHIDLSGSLEWDTIATLTSCDTVILPLISGTGFTDSVRYYTMPNGQGDTYFPGDSITINQKLYVFDPNTLCTQDTFEFDIEITAPTEFDELNLIENCGSYELPDITGTNVGVNAMYFSSPNGNGVAYNSGDSIHQTETLYIFDTTTNCVINQPQVQIVVHPIPTFDIDTYIISCSDFTLPDLQGTNLNGTQAYYTEPFGMGTIIPSGTVFSSDTVFYAYSGNTDCEVNQQITISFENISSGSANNFAICGTSENINLFDGIIAPYTSGGTWTEQGSSTFDLTDPTNVLLPPSALGNSFDFAYTVVQPGCPVVRTIFTLTIMSSPQIGNDTTTSVCLGESTIELADLVSITADEISYSSSNNAITFNNSSANISSLSEGQYEIKVKGRNIDLLNQGICEDSALITLVIIDSPTAGEDVNSSTCQGGVIDLITLLSMESSVGIFECEDYSANLSGSDFNTSGINVPSVEVLHILESNGNCPPDTAILSINIETLPNSGQDSIHTQCIIEEINLPDFLFDADMGGVFVSTDNNYSISTDNRLMVDQPGSSTILYITGNGQDCPRDTAVLSFMFQEALMGQFEDSTCDPTYDYMGNTYTPTNNSGEISLTGSNGCDSIVQVTITFNQSNSGIIDTTLCDNETLVINGNTYSTSNSSGTEILTGMAHNGCDSIVQISIAPKVVIPNDINHTTCDEDYQLVVGGTIFDRNNLSGTVTLPNASISGCDSIVNVNLSISPLDYEMNTVQPECLEDDGLLIIENTNLDSIMVEINEEMTSYDSNDLPIEIGLSIGTHNVLIQSIDQECSDAFDVNIEAAMAINSSIQATPLSDSSWQLNVVADSDLTAYFWTTTSGSLSCWDCPDPIFTGEGTVTVIFDYGNACVDNANLTLTIDINDDFHLPNVISPNGFELNKNFVIFVNDNSGLTINSFAVLDRWGNKMHSISNLIPQNGEILWNGKFNGKHVNPGVYVYVLEATKSTGERVVKYGDITVLR